MTMRRRTFIAACAAAVALTGVAQAGTYAFVSKSAVTKPAAGGSATTGATGGSTGSTGATGGSTNAGTSGGSTGTGTTAPKTPITIGNLGSKSTKVGTPTVFPAPVVGGSPTMPLTFSVMGGLPAGMFMMANTGEIEGTPTVAGVTTTTIVVFDASGRTASAPVTIAVTP